MKKFFSTYITTLISIQLVICIFKVYTIHLVSHTMGGWVRDWITPSFHRKGINYFPAFFAKHIGLSCQELCKHDEPITYVYTYWAHLTLKHFVLLFETLSSYTKKFRVTAMYMIFPLGQKIFCGWGQHYLESQIFPIV